MSDDLVKQALAELQDDVRCRCHPAYKDRGLHDPDCNCDSAGAVQVVAARIQEMEAKLQDMALDCLAAQGQAAEAYQAQLAAEAKLATALERGFWAGRSCGGSKAAIDAALAELKGGKDD